MNKIVCLLPIFALVATAFTSPANAGACDAIAASYASSRGASVLKVRDTGRACRVTILVRNGNRAPRRKTVKLPK